MRPGLRLRCVACRSQKRRRRWRGLWGSSLPRIYIHSDQRVQVSERNQGEKFAAAVTLEWICGSRPWRSRLAISAMLLSATKSSRPEDLGALTKRPVSNPRPSGEYATTAIPSSRAVLRTSSSSMSSAKREYSTWMALMGWTLCARRMVEAVHSERPM